MAVFLFGFLHISFSFITTDLVTFASCLLDSFRNRRLFHGGVKNLPLILMYAYLDSGHLQIVSRAPNQNSWFSFADLPVRKKSIVVGVVAFATLFFIFLALSTPFPLRT